MDESPTSRAQNRARNGAPGNFRAALRLQVAASRPFPPDFWIVGTVQHLRQFELDFAQAVGAQFQSSLVQRRVVALLGETGVQVAKVGNFLAEAGEMFCDVRHLFDHTPYLRNRPVIFLCWTAIFRLSILILAPVW
jgi:hypothetical protein